MSLAVFSVVGIYLIYLIISGVSQWQRMGRAQHLQEYIDSNAAITKV